MHSPGWVWALMVFRHRHMPPGTYGHCSVKDRLVTDIDYRRKIPDEVVWEDEQWLELMI